MNILGINRRNHMQNYIATQVENGFYVEFEDSLKKPRKIGFDEIQSFAQSFNQNILAGKEVKLSDDERLILSIWEMLLIPDNTIH